jgi:hypothetical protein
VYILLELKCIGAGDRMSREDDVKVNEKLTASEKISFIINPFASTYEFGKIEYTYCFLFLQF